MAFETWLLQMCLILSLKTPSHWIYALAPYSSLVTSNTSSTVSSLSLFPSSSVSLSLSLFQAFVLSLECSSSNFFHLAYSCACIRHLLEHFFLQEPSLIHWDHAMCPQNSVHFSSGAFITLHCDHLFAWQVPSLYGLNHIYFDKHFIPSTQ